MGVSAARKEHRELLIEHDALMKAHRELQTKYDSLVKAHLECLKEGKAPEWTLRPKLRAKKKKT